MTSVGAELRGIPLHPGDATGPLLLLREPLSFWGGVDESGRVIDVHHPQHGTQLAGTVLVMSSGRGSSSSAAVLAEQVRAGTAPAALVLGEADGILVAGVLAAAELYDVQVPVLVLGPDELARVSGHAVAAVSARARVDETSATLTVGGSL